MTNKQELVSLESNLPDYLKDEEITGLGLNDLTSEDIKMPNIAIAQGMSKCVKPNEPEYIEGIKQGEIYDTATSAIYGKEVNLCFANFITRHAVFSGSKNSKYIGTYDTPEEADLVKQDQPNPWDSKVIKQHDHYAILEHEGKVKTVRLSLSKTSEKASRVLNTLALDNGRNRYSFIYNVASVTETSKEGDTYYNYKIKTAGHPSEEVYMAAKGLALDIEERKEEIKNKPSINVTPK
jgi:hypothetical protein